MPVVRAVTDLVVLTMAAVAVDVHVAPGAPSLYTPVLATTLAVPEPVAAPVASSVRVAPAPASAVAPIAAAAFHVAVALVAPVQPSPAPAMPMAKPVELPVVTAAPAALAEPAPLVVTAVGPSSSDAMVRDEKRVFYRLFTCLLVLLS